MTLIPTILTTDRLILRRPVEADRDAYVAFYMSDRSKMAMGPLDKPGASAFFDTEVQLWDKNGFGMYSLTVKGSDVPLGLVGLWQPEGWAEPELGWLLWDGAEGHGYASEAAQACLTMWLGIGRPGPVSYIDAANHASQAVARRLGGHLEALDPKNAETQIWRHGPSPVLSTERLILRRPSAKDWPQARAFFMSERSATVGGPKDQGGAWRVLAMEIGHWDMRGYGMWAVTRKGDDTAIGMIGPWHPGDWPETEVGWMIWDPSVEGTGIATEAARAAVEDAYTRLGWDTVVSYIATTNARSIALAEKLGAVLDTSAPQIPGKDPHLVYRHPRPEAR